MKRREFIRLGGFLTVSVAAMGMTGCDIVGDNDNSSTSALDPNLYPNPSRPMPAAASGANWSFPQSVASGDPKSDSIILWTRVVNDAAPSDPTSSAAVVDVAVTLKVVSEDNFTGSLDSNAEITDTPATTVVVPAYADFDGTIRHKLTGLAAGKVYYFQFKAGDVCSYVGRFKTAPAATSTAPVKFAFMTCQDWSANHWGAFDLLVDDDNVDFVVHLGDYIYETNNGGAAGNEGLHGAITLPNGTIVPNPDGSTPGSGPMYATTTDDYRYLYKLYRSDRRIQRMHEHFAMVAVWDDHEFSDDAWMNAETYTNRNTAQATRRRDANQAWFEFMPADVQFQELNPGFMNIQLYRDLQFGQVMHLIMTDERLYRQDHMIPENTVVNGSQLGRINTRYLAPEATMKYIESALKDTAGDLSLVSMLGGAQRAWWKDKMLNSTAKWKVWGNEVSLLRMGLNGTNAVSTLLSLSFVSPVATNIGNAAGASFGGNVRLASAYVGMSFFGASATAAGAATPAMNTSFNTDLGNGLSPADATQRATMVTNMVTAALTAAAGVPVALSVTQATVGAIAYIAAFGEYALAHSTTAQATKAAQAICVGGPSEYFGPGDDMTYAPCVRNEIRANKTASSFYATALGNDATTMAKVGAFFQKFMINADQWDGYRKERAELMNFLLGNNAQGKVIKNVVAVTGDLHAFFAGSVYNEHKGEVTDYTLVGGSAVETGAASANGTAAMVDFVTAGVSSTSWFSYLAAAAYGLDPTNSLIGKLVYYKLDVSALFGEGAGTTYANLNLLDYTMGKAAPATASDLAQQLAPQMKALAVQKYGATDGNVDAITATLLGNLAASPSFAQLVGLAQMLATLGGATNPWLAAGHVDTNAQGYGLFTATTFGVEVTLRKVNPLVGATAPSLGRMVVSDTTMHVVADSAAVVQGFLPV